MVLDFNNMRAQSYGNTERKLDLLTVSKPDAKTPQYSPVGSVACRIRAPMR